MSGNPRADLSDSPASRRDDLTDRWIALHEAAGVVAALAGVPAPVCPGGPEAVPHALRRIGGWRLILGQQAMADLAAILEAGIRALLAVHATGASPHGAAAALWEEFSAARDGLLALAAPEGTLQSS